MVQLVNVAMKRGATRKVVGLFAEFGEYDGEEVADAIGERSRRRSDWQV